MKRNLPTALGSFSGSTTRITRQAENNLSWVNDGLPWLLMQMVDLAAPTSGGTTSPGIRRFCRTGLSHSSWLVICLDSPGWGSSFLHQQDPPQPTYPLFKKTFFNPPMPVPHPTRLTTVEPGLCGDHLNRATTTQLPAFELPPIPGPNFRYSASVVAVASWGF